MPFDESRPDVRKALQRFEAKEKHRALKASAKKERRGGRKVLHPRPVKRTRAG